MASSCSPRSGRWRQLANSWLVQRDAEVPDQGDPGGAIRVEQGLHLLRPAPQRLEADLPEAGVDAGVRNRAGENRRPAINDRVRGAGRYHEPLPRVGLEAVEA